MPQFNHTLALRILTIPNRLSQLRQRLDELADQGISILYSDDTEYPTLLKSVPDAPTVLCRVGALSDVGEKCVAIVGTTHPTADSIDVTLELTMRLVDAGFSVVSGLAKGIDTTAHSGTLEANGTTISVLSQIYQLSTPQKTTHLHERYLRLVVFFLNILFQLHRHQPILSYAIE